MKALLMYKDRDFDLQQPLPPNAEALTQDLELTTLFNAMAGGDKFFLEVVSKAVLCSLADVETIRYRQAVLRDCLANPAIVKGLYAVAIQAIEREKKHWTFGSDYPTGRLRRSVEVLQEFVVLFQRLRKTADEQADRFSSEGFQAFFAMLKRELDGAFFKEVNDHLRRLRFRRGVLVSAELGTGDKGVNFILRKPHEPQLTWWEWIIAWVNEIIARVRRFLRREKDEYTYYLPDRDEAGARALSELRDQGITLVANVLAQSIDHMLSFFLMLRTQLAFYLSCMNLHEELQRRHEPVAFPEPMAMGERELAFNGLYDVCLALKLARKVVGNDVKAEGVALVVITGANTGGKSTFLRGVGLAQLMMQCGMFVGAEAFRAGLCDGLFTHYKREEDTTMRSGKFDEELKRMSEIVDHVRPASVMLFNESFASTNEREGSEIGRQIVRALLDRDVRVFFVTHMYELAHGFFERRDSNMLFLRAERRADGTRTFKLIEGEPLQTSFGQDLYRQVFGPGAAAPFRAKSRSGDGRAEAPLHLATVDGSTVNDNKQLGME